MGNRSFLATSPDNSPAYLLVFHGSRDPRPVRAANRLAELVRARLVARQEIAIACSSPSVAVREREEPPLVEIASLELTEIPLHQEIDRCARVARERGSSELHVIPLFLLRGVHVTEDIRAEVSLARSSLPIEVKPFLGSYPGMIELISRQFERFPATDRILLSHGSRRAGGCRIVESIARLVEAVPAYRSIEPSLSSRIETCIENGARSIAILPYFLFPGAITDEIDREIFSLSQKHKNVKLFSGEPLGATEELARVIVGEVVG